MITPVFLSLNHHYFPVPVPVPVQEFQSICEYGGEDIHIAVFGSVIYVYPL